MEKHTKPDTLDRTLTGLYHTDIPQGYSAAWRQAVQREEKATMKTRQKHTAFWHVALPVVAAIVLVVGALRVGDLMPKYATESATPAPIALSPAGVMPYSLGVNEATVDYESAYDDAAYDDAAYDTAYDAAYGTASVAGSAARSKDGGAEDTTASAKIVYTAELTIATTAFDADTEALVTLTDSCGGYVASVSVSNAAPERKNRMAFYSLRIPGDQLDTFLAGTESIGRITDRYESATDMTTQYSDTQMRLTTQQTKMERLQTLITKADTVTDLLEIESEIADTQYQIDKLETSLCTIDRNVDNSFVTVTVREQSAGDTAQAVELTLWQRITSGFEASVEGLSAFLQNLLVFLVMLLPVLIPLAVLAVLLWLLIRGYRRRRARHVQAVADAEAILGTNEPVSDADNQSPTKQK